MTGTLKYILRLFLLAVVLYIMLHDTSFALIRRLIYKVSIPLLIFAWISFIMRYIIQGFRWYLAALAHRLDLPAQIAIISQIKIAFLEIVFPIPDSEDALRLAFMNRQNINFGAGMASIIYDRMAGISVLIFLLPFSLLLFTKNTLPVYLQSAWLQLFLILAIMPFIVFHRWFISQLLFLTENYFPAQKSRWQMVWHELQKKISLSLVITSLGCVFLYALCGASVAWLLTRSLHGNVSFLVLVAGVPLYYLSGTLPLSIQGLGLYETALVFVLQKQGTDPDTALLVGLLHFIFHITVIVLGGLLYTMERDKKSIEAILLNWTSMLISKKRNS